MTEHRVNYGRLHPGKTYKADCSCGWTFEGTRDETHKAVRDHDGMNEAEQRLRDISASVVILDPKVAQ